MRVKRPYGLLLVLILCVFFSVDLRSQDGHEVHFFDPAVDDRFHIGGQGWDQASLDRPYDRLPADAENIVRSEVWSLSRQSAGIHILFSTSSPTIHVNYEVGGDMQMPHMPATGVSGLDLYRLDSLGQFIWCRGEYRFGDTVTYEFAGLTSKKKDRKTVYTYLLYLPLYNSVNQLKIGIKNGSDLMPVKYKKDLPIVVYGTSIAQGACVSRPGMAWTALLQREIGVEIVNLGFSGNGRLESELVGYLASIKPKLYVLDCLPNLVGVGRFSNEEIRKRYLQAVDRLSAANPGVPILLVQHAGYAEGLYNESAREEVDRLNGLLYDIYNGLLSEGLSNLFFLAKDEIAMCGDCTVDGTHQTDLGMGYYARAYVNKYYEIFGK